VAHFVACFTVMVMQRLKKGHLNRKESLEEFLIAIFFVVFFKNFCLASPLKNKQKNISVYSHTFMFAN